MASFDVAKNINLITLALDSAMIAMCWFVHKWANAELIIFVISRERNEWFSIFKIAGRTNKLIITIQLLARNITFAKSNINNRNDTRIVVSIYNIGSVDGSFRADAVGRNCSTKLFKLASNAAILLLKVSQVVCYDRIGSGCCGVRHGCHPNRSCGPCQVVSE